MQIAVLTSEFPSVSETFVLQHVADLVERGHEVDVFPQRGADGPLHPEVRAQDLLARRFLPPPMPPGRGRRLADAARLALEHPGPDRWALLRSLAPWRFGRQGLSLSLLYRQVPLLARRRGRGAQDGRAYDVVHGHHGPVGLEAAHLQRLGVLRGPLVTSFHGHDVNVAPKAGGTRMYAPLLRRASLLLVSSEFVRARLLALGAPAERVRRQPVGIRPGDFTPARPEHAPDELRLLSVGRLVEVKGFAVALRAVARLAPAHPRLRYVLIGDGPLRPALEAQARRLGIASRVRFAGALPHDAVRRELARAHLYCQPSVRGADGAEEGQGLAVIEAQASGLPAVASRSGGLPESVRDGDTGLLVAPGDDGALARALGTLAADAGRRAALGRAARRFATREFDRATLTDRLLAHYAAVARPATARTHPPHRVAP